MFIGSYTNVAAEGMHRSTVTCHNYNHKFIFVYLLHSRKTKGCILSPIIKNDLIDNKTFKNSRPVSNLAFISKLIEKVLANQMYVYMKVNKLYECMQSVYYKAHSTETALLRVQNDILCAVDDECIVVLILLDLSAASDAVDHTVLISRLSTRCVIKGNALAWFLSYLSDRTQCVGIQGVKSSCPNLKYGESRMRYQGLIMGPVLFSL